MPKQVGCLTVPGVYFPGKALRPLIATVLLFAFGLAKVSAAPHALDHVLIKFKEVETRNRLGGDRDPLLRLTQLLQLPAGARLEVPIVRALVKKAKAQERLALDGFFYLHLPPGLTVEECIKRVQRNPLVEYVEADGIGSGGFIPNDPDFNRQWHHRNTNQPTASIRTPEAWDITQGSSNVLVAVLDTGLGASLAEFAGRVVPGYNFVANNTNTLDDHGHGTSVAGALCASGNNAQRVAGVDWRCRLMPIKVLDQQNFGNYSWWAQAIDYAVASGCKVINLSAGGGGTDITLTRAITNAIMAGAVFITITHNQGGTITYPGNLVQSITVGATDEQDRRCGFSNFGPQIDLVAPGTNIYTVSRFGSLQWWWGTSFAAPQAAGVAALLLSVNSNLNHYQIRDLLCYGADDGVGGASDTPGFDNNFGWGRLNACNSLKLAQTRISQIGFNPLQLCWPSPSNASNKHPFRVEWADSLTGSWMLDSTTNQLRYETNRTYWTQSDTASTARFYRLRLAPLP